MSTKSNLFLMSARMLSCMSFCSCWISLSRSLLSASIPPCSRHTWFITNLGLDLKFIWPSHVSVQKKKTASSQSQSKKGTWEKELQMDKPLPLFLPPSKHWSLHGLWVELDENLGRSTLDSWRSCYGGTLLCWRVGIIVNDNNLILSITKSGTCSALYMVVRHVEYVQLWHGSKDLKNLFQRIHIINYAKGEFVAFWMEASI